MAHNGPWNIYIDIEGFSALWGAADDNDKVLWALGELLLGVFRIGRKVYPREPDRLFTVQAGDGVFIHSDFPEQYLTRAVCIAVALMRHVAADGRLAKVAIAEGEVADINECYPKELRAEQRADGSISLGSGRLQTFPHMGAGIVNSAFVAKRSPKGPLLIIETAVRERLPREFPITECDGSRELSSVDWVHLQSNLLNHIQETAELKAPASSVLENMLRGYCNLHKTLPQPWRENVHNLLGISNLDNS